MYAGTGVAGVAKGTMAPHKFLQRIVILCFERCFFKQNGVIRLQTNILTSPNILAHTKFLGWLRHCMQGPTRGD